MTFTGCKIESIQFEMSRDLNKIFEWLCVNKLTLNVLKTDFMLIGSHQKLAVFEGALELSINGVSLKQVQSVKCLRIIIYHNLTWKSHIESIRVIVSRNLAALKLAKKVLNKQCLISTYRAIIEPYSTYSSIVWDNISDTLDKKLQNCKIEQFA